MLDVVEALWMKGDPRRELEMHGAELAGSPQDLEHAETVARARVESPPARLRRRRSPLSTGPSAARMSFARLHRRLVPREESICLDVENELGRRPLDPEACILFDRNAVVAAVDLHDRKLRRVVAEPIFRCPGACRIEAAGVDQRLVGPGRVADQDVRHELL